jgi:hypothetical protein
MPFMPLQPPLGNGFVYIAQPKYGVVEYYVIDVTDVAGVIAVGYFLQAIAAGAEVAAPAAAVGAKILQFPGAAASAATAEVSQDVGTATAVSVSTGTYN